MKLFTTQQIPVLDAYTIEHEPIADIDLMERAALQVSNWLEQNYSSSQKFVLLAGPGNNGGDALAVARQVSERGLKAEVFLFNPKQEYKGAPALNMQRLAEQGGVKVHEISSSDDFPVLQPEELIIDGLFGSGLTRPLDGLAAEIVHFVNKLPNRVVAIDIPSGLMGEDNSSNNPDNIIRATHTLTFQFPKIAFLLSENEVYTGKWEVLPIGLHPAGIAGTETPWNLTDGESVKQMIPRRNRFDHKGVFGHALLLSGSYGKMGAAVLASKACLRAGAGLLTTHVPHFGYNIIQAAVPEAMASVDVHDSIITGFPETAPYTAVGAGPGMGIKSNSCKALHELIRNVRSPLVLDADALNILALHREWMNELPPETILTPHPGEFKRLAGDSSGSWERLRQQKEMAETLNLIVVLKGAYTSVALPDGTVWFNPTGNPGMATAGSGDVLTGLILGLLAQGMPPRDAAIAGVYLHGLAGDAAAATYSELAMVAGDIIASFGDAVKICLGD